MRRLGLGIAKAILLLIVVGCIAISAVFAFEFGFGKGVGPVHQWAFGLAGGGLDLLKAALPIIAAAALATGLRLKGAVAWVAYVVLTGMSLWCAFGTTAGQLAERMGNKAVAQTEQAQRQATLDRLRSDRARLPQFVPVTEDAVEAARGAVTAAADQKTAECVKRGPMCREREADERKARADLAEAEGNRATTDRAADLDTSIAAAERALAAVDVRTAEKEADPQAASLSKATGWNADAITLFSHALFAVGIEIGSGLGLWLLFGHGHQQAPARDCPSIAHRLPDEDEDEAAPSTTTTADASRALFFAECVHHAADSNVAAGVMHGAYERWCGEKGFTPVDRYAFGRGAPWVYKKKIGGVVHYMNCAVTTQEPAKAAQPQLRVVHSQ